MRRGIVMENKNIIESKIVFFILLLTILFTSVVIFCNSNVTVYAEEIEENVTLEEECDLF